MFEFFFFFWVFLQTKNHNTRRGALITDILGETDAGIGGPVSTILLVEDDPDIRGAAELQRRVEAALVGVGG